LAAPTAVTSNASSQDPNTGTNNNTTTFGILSGAGAVGAIAAGVFYMRRGQTATAQLAEPFANNPANMNPLYEGQQHFENPLYDPNDMTAGIDDGFENTDGGADQRPDA